MTQYNKVFFQAGPTGNNQGWGELVTECNALGIPIGAAASDSMTLLYDLQSNSINKGNFIPTNWNGERFDFDKTIYSSKTEALTAWRNNAIEMWRRADALIPPELNRDQISISLENEQAPYVDWHDTGAIPGFTGWADVFGAQAKLRGEIALSKGYHYRAFAYAGGNPEYGAWSQPNMLDFLRFCETNPTIGVALHEYSFADNLESRDHIGRFQHLLETCNAHNIKYPKIAIKEWGWTEREVPSTETMFEQIKQIADLYAKYPCVEFCAIWTTQNGWEPAGQRVSALIPLIKNFTLNYRYEGEIDTGQQTYKSVPVLCPQNWALSQLNQVQTDVFSNRRTVTQSLDEAIQLVNLGSSESYLIVYGFDEWSPEEQARILSVPHTVV